MMKYICVVGEFDSEEIIVFPMTINHDCMYEGISRLKNQTHGSWQRIDRHVVSAGFVSPDLQCFGQSITLNVGSRGEEDTALLKKQMEESR